MLASTLVLTALLALPQDPASRLLDRFHPREGLRLRLDRDDLLD